MKITTENKETEERTFQSKIYKDDSFYLGYAEYTQNPKLLNISKIINEKNRTVKETDSSYRIINFWEKTGLINNERSIENGWRKFSIMDRVWLKIINELRRFGYPNELIKKVKLSLESLNSTDFKQSDYLLLELYVAQALMKRPCYLLVFNDGDAEPVLNYEIINHNFFTSTIMKHEEKSSKGKLDKKSTTFYGLDHFISININKIVQELFPKKSLSPNYESQFELNSDEQELILEMRTTDYDEITVVRKNGKIERLEGTENIETDKRIVDILKEGDYQDISLKQNDGKIVSIKRTVKKKINKSK